jgi:hypothetical protein
MSFSAATCLTDTPFGVTLFNVYLGQNNYASPNLIASLVPVSDLTVNCPYIINNIPDGTTYLSFKDSSGTYCISIPIQDNNICDNCDLGFSNYSSPSISKISCGELTGSCNNNITDYLIHWYGPDDTTTLSFTSGKGNMFSYQIEHPFITNNNSMYRESGVYTPIIENVIVNGISYSNTGGTENILFDGSNCIQPIIVLPLTCNVRTNTNFNFPYSAYTNLLLFDSQTQGQPQVFSSTYKISASTKYISWSFFADDAVDRIKLSFSGSAYGTNKIGLDDFVVGSDLSSSNFNPSTYPKSADTSQSLSEFFTKLTCLTGLTVNDNDNIILNITPSLSDTKWTLYITCLDDYNCEDCLLTQDYKIIGSTITGTTDDCDKLNVKFTISGCSKDDVNSDYLLYYTPLNSYRNSNNLLGTNNLINLTSGDMYFDNSRCTPNNPSIEEPSCQTDSTPTIYKKTFLGDNRGVFGFTGSSTFISTYYNSIKNAFSGLPPYTSNWSGSSNSSDISYYKAYKLKLPLETSSDACGDSDTSYDIVLHQSSQYITGTTGTNHYLMITANTISQNISFGNCVGLCNNQILQIIFAINNCSTGSTPSYGTNQTFNNGLYYSNPLYTVNFSTLSNTPITGSSLAAYFQTPDWSFNTYPFSGNPSIIIPSLSGTVCNYMSTGRYSNLSTVNSFSISQYKYYYNVRMTNPSDANDFDIWASPITNFNYSGTTVPLYELAYRYSGGNVTFSSTTYIIG